MRARRGRLPLPRSLLPLTVFPIILLVGAYVLAAWPSSTLYGPVTAHGGREERMVALTFDDGPNVPATTEILDVLRQEDVRATFFVTGAGATVAPDVVRRAVTEGHVVGNHSFRHKKRDAFCQWNYEEAVKTQRAIEAAAGVTPALYRPPNGFHTPWQLRAVRDAGMRTIVWDVDPYDWKDPAPETIVRRVLNDVQPGSIVLLHDGMDTRQGADRSATLAALPLLIRALRERGYRLVTVPELLKIPAYLDQRSVRDGSPA